MNGIDSRARWTLAAVISIVLHVVGIGVWYHFACPDSTAEAAEEKIEEKTKAEEKVEKVEKVEKRPVEKVERVEGVEKRPVERVERVEKKVEKVERVEKVEKPVGVKSEKRGEEFEWHVVKKGEYLAKIAEQYDTTLQELVKLNGIRDLKKGGNLHVGQKIKVPVK